MIDTFALPNAPRQIVYVGTEIGSIPPITIQVPKEAKFVFFTIIGGGGGGARPTAGAAASGGGGGGSGSVTHGLFLAKELPPQLYGYISKLGAGGTTNGSNGSNGIGVYLSAVSGTSLPATRDTFLFANGGGGGQASGTGGTGGNAPGVTALGLTALWFNNSAGQAGGIGAIGNGANVNIVVSNFCSGGGGGAGSNVASSTGGGQVSSSALYPSLAASASDGLGGYIVQRPFICIGGCGGGGTSGATGFNGGNAAYIGAGGGGGGNGVTTSGNGGDGGAGAIIMRWW